MSTLLMEETRLMSRLRRAGETPPPALREHGAWGILLLPALTAVTLAEAWNVSSALLLAGMVFFYLSRTSFLRGMGKWTLFLLGLSAALAIPVMVRSELWWLPAFGLAGAVLGFRKTTHSIAQHIVAVLGLTLTAPVMWYGGTGSLGAKAWILWGLNAAYFIGGVLHVKMHIAAAVRRCEFEGFADRLRLGYVNVGWHALVVVLVSVLWPVMGWAYVPALMRSALGTALLSPRLQIKRLGWTEVAHSLVFAVLLVATMRA
jgi:hypothetical protein